MAKNQKNVNVEEFISAVEKMLESKYILIDRKISDILFSIASTKDVYNVVAESMINFDFKKQWKDAVNTNFIKLPESDSDRIAFIFCLLNNIDDKNLDATKILDKYYSYDSNLSPYQLFCENVIDEFRRLVLKKLNFNDDTIILDEKPEVSVDEYLVLKNMLHDFGQYLVVQKKLKKCFVKKEELIAIVSTFEQVVERKQSEYFYAFEVIINSAIKKDRQLTKKYSEISKMISEIMGR